MKLFLITACTMAAFASNSILTRMAIEPGYIDPISFGLLRVLAGAIILFCLLSVNGKRITWRARGRIVGSVSLAVYIIGFSLAYVSLDAGLGALILFGVVQIIMFGYSVFTGAQPTNRQFIGAGVAFVGLIIALWPDTASDALGSVSATLLMVVAGVGWAVYTLSGKNAENPLGDTAANFAICLPILALLTLPFVEKVTMTGVSLAVICGALTSGLGYALWYKVLPDLQRSVAAVVQLSVPIIAIFLGAILLGESVTLPVFAAATLVIVGISLAVTKQSLPEDHT
ncbi:MAG: DMT family transporter [Roseobacter sp.]